MELNFLILIDCSMNIVHIVINSFIECSQKVDYKVICEQMGRTPPWLPGILLRADGYETAFYKKD